jgi:excisionase family DNA binding protein
MVTVMHRTKPSSDAISNSDPDLERLAYSVPQAAELIGISARRLWDHVRTKKIKTFRDGNRRLISRSACQAFIAQREAEQDEVA